MNMGLRRSRLRVYKAPADVDPLAGMANIVDAMLVFACGLMLSLIINWNVDLVPEDSMVELEQGEDVSQVQEAQDNLTEDSENADSYEKMGTVYKDPVSGKLFMLTDK